MKQIPKSKPMGVVKTTRIFADQTASRVYVRLLRTITFAENPLARGRKNTKNYFHARRIIIIDNPFITKQLPYGNCFVSYYSRPSNMRRGIDISRNSYSGGFLLSDSLSLKLGSSRGSTVNRGSVQLEGTLPSWRAIIVLKVEAL